MSFRSQWLALFFCFSLLMPNQVVYGSSCLHHKKGVTHDELRSIISSERERLSLLQSASRSMGTAWLCQFPWLTRMCEDAHQVIRNVIHFVADNGNNYDLLKEAIDSGSLNTDDGGLAILVEDGRVVAHPHASLPDENLDNIHGTLEGCSGRVVDKRFCMQARLVSANGTFAGSADFFVGNGLVPGASPSDKVLMQSLMSFPGFDLNAAVNPCADWSAIHGDVPCPFAAATTTSKQQSSVLKLRRGKRVITCLVVAVGAGIAYYEEKYGPDAADRMRMKIENHVVKKAFCQATNCTM